MVGARVSLPQIDFCGTACARGEQEAGLCDVGLVGGVCGDSGGGGL